jgi:drug/metabolite transporter (DMT)-like permease
MTAGSGIAARPHRGRDEIYPFVLLLLANLFWASNWVIGRGIHETFPPVALSFWRWAVASVVLAPIALPRLKGQWPIVRAHWRILLILGACGIAVPQCVTYIGLNYTTAVNGSLLTAGNPMVMVLVAWLMERHTASPRQLLGLMLSLSGVIIVIAHGSLTTLQQFRFNPGDLLIVLAIPIWCVYSVLLRRRPRDVDGMAFLFLLTPIGLATLAPAFAYEEIFVRTPVWNLVSVATVIYIGISASAGAYALWNRGVELLGPNRAAFTNPFQPMFATSLAVLVLGERFYLYHAVGFAMIIAGWYLTSGLRLRPPV